MNWTAGLYLFLAGWFVRGLVARVVAEDNYDRITTGVWILTVGWLLYSLLLADHKPTPDDDPNDLSRNDDDRP